jgi:cytochrome c biogenesis protein CcmG/thiol:disulfide interchange protein DsbE
MKFLKWVLPCVLVYGAYAYGQNEVKNLAGRQMPSFKMTSFDGTKITSASLKGKPYILDFWATWCGPCKLASPTMQSIHEKYSGKGLVVIGVNMGETPGSMPQAKSYPKEHKYTYKFTSKNDDFAEKIGIEGIPCFIFVDKSGKVVAVKTGVVPGYEAEFDKIAKSLL